MLAEVFGVTMYLYDGKERNVIFNIVKGKNIGTVIKKNVRMYFTNYQCNWFLQFPLFIKVAGILSSAQKRIKYQI